MSIVDRRTQEDKNESILNKVLTQSSSESNLVFALKPIQGPKRKTKEVSFLREPISRNGFQTFHQLIF